MERANIIYLKYMNYLDNYKGLDWTLSEESKSE